MSMKKTVLAASTLALLGIAPATLANDFQIEVEASYEMAEEGPADIKTFAVGGTYYVERVSTRSGPLNEAGYLSKSSYINAAFESVGGDGDDDIIEVGGRFITDTNLFAGATYRTGDFTDVLGFELGTYLSDNSSVHAGLARSETETPVGDMEADTITLVYKSIMEQGDGTAMGIEASVLHVRPDGADNINSLELDAKYFMTRATHVGLLLGYTPTSDFKSKSYGLSVQSFVDPMIALGASFEREDPDAGDETDTITLWLKGRF